MVPGNYQQTNGEIRNITQSLGMTVDMGHAEKRLRPCLNTTRSILIEPAWILCPGAFDYNTVLRRVVKEMTASGTENDRLRIGIQQQSSGCCAESDHDWGVSAVCSDQ